MTKGYVEVTSMQKSSPYSLLFSLLLLLAVLPVAVPTAGLADNRPAADSAAASQEVVDYPFEILSREHGGLLIAEVSGEIDYPYASIRKVLTEPDTWCDFLPLVFNIKSSTYRRQAGQYFLTLYLGRKFYEPPEKAIQLEYKFDVRRNDDNALQILLSAADGPYGTSDYTIRIDVNAAGENRTKVRMHSSFRPSLASQVATRLYLLTLGRNKVGFSVAGFKEGKPVYCRGIKGIVERNAMRYYFAIKSYLDTLQLPASQRFEARLNNWYDLTDRYHKQLYEMDKPTYLAAKRKERLGQMQLQEQTTSAL